jgi:hypothetical protein
MGAETSSHVSELVNLNAQDARYGGQQAMSGSADLIQTTRTYRNGA